ncbi:MAG: hypothetical protein ACTSQF_09505 [Candidatus Heimdallarchaeaceae archaeon]
MSKKFPYDLWITAGSDAGISFATIGRLAKDSSMMQGILLSLQTLMTTEVNVTNSHFMTGENEYVKFGTFTLSEEAENVVVQYVVKSDQPNKLSKEDEKLVQELAFSFCRFIILTPKFHQHLATGRMISSDNVSKAFLKACTIAKQKISVQKNNKGLLELIEKNLKNVDKDSIKYPTIAQLRELKEWIGEDENSWDKGAIIPFKRQLLIQMVAQDILNQIIAEDPFVLIEYETPRYVVEEIRNHIDRYLRSKEIKPKELIDQYLMKNLDKKVNAQIKNLSIDEIHSANSFIAHNLAKDVIFSLSKENPICALIDFRSVDLYSAIRNEIGVATEVPNPGNMICDALIEDVTPLALQSARLFFNQLIKPFVGRKLPLSIWNVIVDFSFSILDEKKIKPNKNKQAKKPKTAISIKRDLMKDRTSKLSVVQPKWIKELTKKFNEMGVGKQLQISNIEESVLFANALERAIITTLEKIVKDQLFNSNLGDIFVYMISSFKDIAPKTVYVNILEGIIEDLRSRNYEAPTQMGLNTKDLVGSAVEEGMIKAHVNSVPVQLKKSFFKGSFLRFDGRRISAAELLQKQGITLNIGNKVMPLRDAEKDAEFLTTCFMSTKILKRSYPKAILRGMIESYLQQMFHFEGEVYNQLDTLITVFNREVATKLTPAHRLPEIRNSFPSFPLIRDIPQKFTGKNFHERFQEGWNIHAPKIHKAIQDLLTGFTSLRSKDLNYKKKAMKLYNSSIKELKDIRKNLIKNWNPLNDQMTKMVENWSDELSVDLSSHLDTVSKKASSWVGNEFKIQKLEYGKFTVSEKQSLKEIIDSVNRLNPHEIADLPKNFMEIAISILLYRRIPEYVIDESYSQMISGDKKVADSVVKAWAKSQSRKEFENNLYLNMRSLGNTFTKMINTYGRLTSTLFVKNDLELSSDINGCYIVLGRLPKDIYSTKTSVFDIIKFPNIDVVSHPKDWEIRLYLEPDYKKDMDEYRDKLIVMSDIIGFVARKKFNENTGPVLEGIKSVISYLIEGGDTNIIDLSETIKEALFRVSEYPTAVTEEKE